MSAQEKSCPECGCTDYDEMYNDETNVTVYECTDCGRNWYTGTITLMDGEPSTTIVVHDIVTDLRAGTITVYAEQVKDTTP